MGKSSSTGGLSSACPACNKTHYADRLDDLVQAVRRCCAQPKNRARRTKSTVVRPPPSKIELPIVLEFDRLVSSQNKTTYAHWTHYNRELQDWRRRCTVTMLQLSNIQLWYSRWRLVRQYRPPHRELDWANLVGGAKPLIDCLVEFGVIHDDRPAHFKCEYEDIKGPVDKTFLSLLDYEIKT